MLLLVFAFISIAFSFLCSIWEAVLLSIPASYVEMMKSQQAAFAQTLQQLKDDIDKPLSAILSLNTIAHTVGAIGVGAQAEKTLGTGDIQWAGFTLPFSSEALVATVMTLAILILSEIIPKTIGATYWKSLSGFTVRSLKVVMVIMAPFVWLSQLITRMIKGSRSQELLSREEVSAMGKIGHQTGILNKAESNIIANLMRFHAIEARAIMTPDTVVVMEQEEVSISQFLEQHRPLAFSRIPLYGADREDVKGYVLKDTLLEKVIDQEGDDSLKSVVIPILAIKENTHIQEIFSRFLKERQQIAAVFDNFGAFTGIVTMEDVIETLLGLEIVDELDSTVDMQELARQQWEKRARRIGLITEEDKKDSTP